MTERLDDPQRADKPSAPCHLCGGTGKVIVRGSTDGHEWTYACHHNGTLAPINPWQTGGPGQGVPGVNVTVTYGDSKMKCPSNIGGDCLHQPKGCPSACVRPMVEAELRRTQSAVVASAEREHLASILERGWLEIAAFFRERNWPDTKLGNGASAINDRMPEILAVLRAQSSVVPIIEELAKDAEYAQECAMEHGLRITELKTLAGRIRALQSARTPIADDVVALMRAASRLLWNVPWSVFGRKGEQLAKQIDERIAQDQGMDATADRKGVDQ